MDIGKYCDYSNKKFKKKVLIEHILNTLVSKYGDDKVKEAMILLVYDLADLVCVKRDLIGSYQEFGAMIGEKVNPAIAKINQTSQQIISVMSSLGLTPKSKIAESIDDIKFDDSRDL